LFLNTNLRGKKGLVGHSNHCRRRQLGGRRVLLIAQKKRNGAIFTVVVNGTGGKEGGA